MMLVARHASLSLSIANAWREKKAPMATQPYKDRSGRRIPSVTTIINRFKDSGGLLYWANQQGLEGKTLDESRHEAVAPGTIGHLMVEAHIQGQEYSPEQYPVELLARARAAFAAYLAWEKMTAIRFRHTEVALTSEKHRFGGTFDAIGLIGNELVLCDWKCANAVYPDHLYQLAAYKILWEENYPDHPIVGGFHLCRFAKELGDFSHHCLPSLDEEAETFLFMRALYDRVKLTEKRVR
jgi:hypothetical protein